MQQQPLRILLADDHEMVRRSLRALLQPRWEIAAEVSNGREAVEQTRSVRPDVCVLDARMPAMNGIEAAREILRHRPGTPIVLLTVAPTPEMNAEARAAGVEAVIAKSDAEALVTLLARLETATVHLAGCAVRDGRHVGAFFMSNAERHRVIGPFLAEGLARGERALYVTAGGDHATRIDSRADAGLKLDNGHDPDAWQLAAWDEVYLGAGGFDPDDTLTRIRTALASGVEKGFPVTRFVAHMEWALDSDRALQQLVEFETRVNVSLAPSRDVIVCTYDLSRFGADVIVDLMRAHPALVVGGTLVDSPFYVPPAAFLSELADRARG